MNSRYLLSVVIPIYNVEKYLEQCVESVINQTYTNLEIILVDDGSPDSCPALCDAYAKRDSRIRVIHKENGGLVSARKAGVCAVTGDYAIYLDGDDWVDLDLYEKLMAQADETEVDMIALLGHTKEYEDGRSIVIQSRMKAGVYQKEDFTEQIIPHLIRTDSFYSTDLPGAVWSYMIKRNLLLEGQLQIDDRIRVGEDMLCVWECLLRARSIAVVDINGYHYRQQSDSMLHMHSEEEFENTKILYRQMKELFAKSKYAQEIMTKKLNYFTYFILLMSSYNKFVNEKYDFLFPYEQVKAKCRIVLYGAGVLGKQMMSVLKDSSKYEVVGWADKGFAGYQKQGGWANAIAPSAILNLQFDYVVIAVTRNVISEVIKKELMDLGIEEQKIALFNPDLLTEKNLPYQIFEES